MAEFIDFATNYLSINKLRGDLNIKLKENLEENSFGLCWGDKQEVDIYIASKQWGQTISREDKLRTLAHEITHAHQYLTGHLVAADVEDMVAKWLGEDYPYTLENEHETPWESEAVICEERIYNAWLNR